MKYLKVSVNPKESAKIKTCETAALQNKRFDLSSVSNQTNILDQTQNSNMAILKQGGNQSSKPLENKACPKEKKRKKTQGFND